MARMRTFRYDPSRKFRGWLWRLFQSRAIDLIRSRRAMMVPSPDVFASGAPIPLAADEEPGDEEDEAARKPASLLLQRLAAEAQDSVRSRVDPQTWRRLLVRRD